MTDDSLGYVWEKFHTGASSLDDWAHLPPRENLENAYASQVMRADRPGPGLSDELRDRILRLHEQMRRIPDPTEGEFGTIAATVAGMSDEEVAHAIAEIRAIAAELEALRKW